MDVKSHTLVANARTRVHHPGRFFILIETGAALDVTFEFRGSPIGEIGTDVQAGYKRFPGDWADPEDGRFDTVVLTSATAQTVVIGISQSAADYTRTVSIVQTKQPASIIDIAQKSVTTLQTIASSNGNRARVIIQNVDTSGIVRVGGGGLSATEGVQLKIGMSWVTDGTYGVNCISEDGTAVLVSVIEEEY